MVGAEGTRVPLADPGDNDERELLDVAADAGISPDESGKKSGNDDTRGSSSGRGR